MNQFGVHSRCGLHTRAVTVFRDPLSEGFRHFVSSMPAPVASGWSGRRVGLAPTGKAPPCHGAHPNRTYDPRPRIWVRNSNLFGRAIEFHRKLDGSSLLRSVGRGAESSHQDCARAQLRWPVFLNFHLSQSRSPDAAIPACAEEESYPLGDMGADLGLQRL